MTANVSTYVKYVNTFVCQNYLHKIVVLCISISGRQERICGAKLSYVNSSDTNVLTYFTNAGIFAVNAYLNISNMLKIANIYVCILYPLWSAVVGLVSQGRKSSFPPSQVLDWCLWIMICSCLGYL